MDLRRFAKQGGVDPMPVTMSDVARSSGVSVSTVSHVINGTRVVDPATSERVRWAIERLGYRHNRLARAVARGGRTHSIGVVMSARSNPHFGLVVSAIDAAAAADGSTILLGETGDDVDRERHLVDSLLQHRVDGIVIAPGPRADRDTLPALAKSGVPTVLVDRTSGHHRFDHVGTENVEPVAALVTHLAAVHGYRRIAFISGMAGISTTEERLAGYALGVQRCGAVRSAKLVRSGASSREGGAAACASLLDLASPPRAIVTGNNAITVGVLHELNARGVRVPDEVAVAGFDDFEWAPLLVSPLTSIAQDWDTIGRRAFEILLERMAASEAPPVAQRTPTTMMIRNSCGCVGPARSILIPVTDPERAD
jgi:LacI family transcriptional regulator